MTIKLNKTETKIISEIDGGRRSFDMPSEIRAIKALERKGVLKVLSTREYSYQNGSMYSLDRKGCSWTVEKL